MNSEQFRDQIACAIAGIDPEEEASSAKILEEGGFYTRADAVLAILEGVRAGTRKAVLEEVARDYHEALAAALEGQATDPQFQSQAPRLHTLAEFHAACARQIRDQVWTQQPAETLAAASPLEASPSAVRKADRH